MFRKKEPTQQIEKAVARSVNFELTIADIARQSERRAWFVAFGAILLSLILAAAAAVLLLAVGRSRKSHLPLGPALVVGVSGCLLW